MGEKIDPTWLCWRHGTPIKRSEDEQSLARVAKHYCGLVDYPSRSRLACSSNLGLAIIEDAKPNCRWPYFAEDQDVAIAAAYVPYGWQCFSSSESLDSAALELARAALEDPDAVGSRLVPPSAIAILNRRAKRMVVLNDAISAARIYQLHVNGTTAWSNRPGALVLFLGVEARPDTRAWMVMAAASWFLGSTAPIEGMERLPFSTVVEVDEAGVRRRRSNAIAEVIRSDDSREALVAHAAHDAHALVRAAQTVWPSALKVDLSGGRDSRLVSAAVVASGADAVYRTSDATPGEADVARELVAAAPREMAHQVYRTEAGSATPSTPLLERAANLHHLHDGVRHPQKLRGKMTLPRPRPRSASFSGHGGEIAHGFFYKNARQLRALRLRPWSLTSKVTRFFERGVAGALPEAYDLSSEIVSQTLEEGRELRLRGPVLLDWFYLVDRLAHRSGVGTDSERVSIFATPGFIRAAFDLKPAERLSSSLHDEMIGALVPEWREIPFFSGPISAMPQVRRQRIWEIPEDAAEVDELIAGNGRWTDCFDPKVVKETWTTLKSGRGSARWEGLIEGVVFLETFDLHLRLLNEQSRRFMGER